MGWGPGWLRWIGRAAEKVAPVVVPGGAEVVAAKRAIESVVKNQSAENIAAVLLITAIQEGAQEPKIKNIALKIHDAIQIAYANDSEFRGVTIR